MEEDGYKEADIMNQDDKMLSIQEGVSVPPQKEVEVIDIFQENNRRAYSSCYYSSVTYF